jgi:hypothetical protein
VERDLEELILYRLKIFDTATIKELTAEGAPLSTFFGKIELGRVLKLYPDEVAHNLHIIRRIRNVFAHSIKLVKFDHDLIEAEIKKTKWFKPIGKDIRPLFKEIFAKTLLAKQRYFLLCLSCDYYLMRRAHVSLKTNKMARERRKAKKALLNARIPMSQLSRLTGLINSAPTQTGDPIPSKAARTYSELASLLAHESVKQKK